MLSALNELFLLMGCKLINEELAILKSALTPRFASVCFYKRVLYLNATITIVITNKCL